MLKVNIETTETPKPCVKSAQWRPFDIFIVNFEQISHIFLLCLSVFDFEQVSDGWLYLNYLNYLKNLKFKVNTKTSMHMGRRTCLADEHKFNIECSCADPGGDQGDWSPLKMNKFWWQPSFYPIFSFSFVIIFSTFLFLFYFLF